jgi:hypothetical protein
MSAALPARAKALRERLVALDQLGANVEETGLLQDLRSDLAPHTVEFSRALDQHKLLVDSGIESAAPASLDAVRKRAAGLLEKFTADKKASTLKRGVGWANLIRDTKVASGDLSAAVVKSWKAYRHIVFTGEAPGVIRGRIAFTPANSAAFTEYERLHQAFRTEFDRPPADKARIEKVRTLAAKLTETAKFFDFDVPGEVKRFLEAIQSGGATLDLLTDTVKDWLKANNAFDSYRILPRSVDGHR